MRKSMGRPSLIRKLPHGIVVVTLRSFGKRLWSERKSPMAKKQAVRKKAAKSPKTKKPAAKKAAKKPAKTKRAAATAAKADEQRPATVLLGRPKVTGEE